MKKYLFLIPILMFLLVTNLWATPMSDQETLGDGLDATNAWTGATLDWSVAYSGGHWVYNYTFNTNVGSANQISHLIIQVSENFTRDDMLTGTTQLGQGVSGSAGETYPLLDSYSSGSANPGLPRTITGIKWQDPDTPNASTWVVTIVTDRAPVDGIFYAVDGKGSNPTYAYSTTDKDGYNLQVPDTKMAKVPEPITLILFGMGFVGAGFYRRMRRPK